jgi:hypothetical protein
LGIVSDANDSSRNPELNAGASQEDGNAIMQAAIARQKSAERTTKNISKQASKRMHIVRANPTNRRD